MHYKQFSYIFLILFLLGSCGEQEEGCLDIIATNFDASADKDCCCEYPQIILNVSHQFDVESFRLESPYTLNEIDTFMVEEMTLLFSNIHPAKDGVTYITDDTIHLAVNDDQGELALEIEDNFIAIKPTKFAYEVGTFPYPDMYTDLEMTFGLAGDVNRVDPVDVHTTGHILNNESDTIWAETEKFFYLYLTVYPDYNNLDTKREIILSGEENSMNLVYNSTFDANIGYDFEINFKIDYKLLFEGIDFVGDDDMMIASKVKDNLITAMTIDTE